MISGHSFLGNSTAHISEIAFNNINILITLAAAFFIIISDDINYPKHESFIIFLAYGDNSNQL